MLKALAVGVAGADLAALTSVRILDLTRVNETSGAKYFEGDAVAYAPQCYD
ncbi:hypothetical protein [Cutibacterium acnes]|uniref:hypothetical protein n=1 Tax=Cutibacterium acnes TaxID=1747 RepID=UPI0001EF23A1|nr:hypothetical protein [Cutibacterium acnes]EFS40727.1 hypothetical protein HMPREF9575_01641 [Cutibacterium acnes HL110PA1]EFS44371.1 hypothetical protein HMPREF9576_00300 [Cutibacterium acnes HL110PA2]EFS66830.1 hypothetical protein HMPREF9612_00731 [Cutibacterium acnes HL063PA2]EFS77266.1 hypothetical protein HMPREF9591_00691 [Cutibacterium acnes HL086PA1]EFT08047.1 hypothetical protein HMPREF9618_00913 [Cutibacterium acnes HL082PA1]EFT51095.1 hypothetical protein HMPREF9565_00679 [Cutibac